MLLSHNIAFLIDHTNLKPEARSADIEKLCREAVQYGFASVCVNPCYVAEAAGKLAGTKVRVCCVVGFPLGASTTACKAFEAQLAVKNGASEIDMVMNVGWLKDRRYDDVKGDIAAVVEAVPDNPVKVILETCLLDKSEIVKACRLAKDAGAAFVKTSTGFSSGGATAEDVALMRQTVGPDMGVKASGGIRTREAAEAMIEAGADRLGISKSVEICSTGPNFQLDKK
jgi:deoxyribose-phosphate aldolase